jgi:uncharacterized protein (TIGR00730 family)
MATATGRALATRGIGLVYGGANVGLMGALADAALAGAGEVIGVMPRSLMDHEIVHPGLSELHVVESLHTRKAMMAEFSDAFLTLPGAYGTLDELFDTITWTQLGLYRKPLGLLNTAGYYDDLLRFLDHTVAEGFLKPENRALLLADANLDSLLDAMASFEMPSVDKWIERRNT